MPRTEQVGEAAQTEAETFLGHLLRLKTIFCEVDGKKVLEKRKKYTDCNECKDVSFLMGPRKVGRLKLRRRFGGAKKWVWCLNCIHAREHRKLRPPVNEENTGYVDTDHDSDEDSQGELGDYFDSDRDSDEDSQGELCEDDEEVEEEEDEEEESEGGATAHMDWSI